MEKASDNNKKTPVVLHYYDDGLFGHVALQVGNYYFTYGKNEEFPVRHLSKKADAIAAETKLYGKHFAVCLASPSPGRIDSLKDTWKKIWISKEYNTLTHNCAHATLDSITHLGLLEEKQTVTRPYEVVCLALELRFKEIKRERDAILEEKINVFKQVEKLIQNEIEKLQAEIIQQKIKIISVDIEKKQARIIALFQLKRALPYKNPAEIANLCAQVSAQECRQLLKHQKKDILELQILKYRESYFAALSVRKNISACFSHYAEITHIIEQLSTKELIGEKLVAIQAEALKKTEKDCAIDLSPYKHLKEIALLAKKAEPFLTTLRVDVPKNLHDQYLSLRLSIKSAMTAGDIADLKQHVTTCLTLQTSTKQPLDNSVSFTAEHLDWLIYQVNVIYFWLQYGKKADNLVHIQHLLIACYTEADNLGKTVHGDIFLLIEDLIKEARKTSKGSILDKKLARLQEKIEQFFLVDEDESQLSKARFLILAQSITKAPFHNNALRSHLKYCLGKLKGYLLSHTLTYTQALQEIVGEIAYARQLSIKGFLGKDTFVFAADLPTLERLTLSDSPRSKRSHFYNLQL